MDGCQIVKGHENHRLRFNFRKWGMPECSLTWKDRTKAKLYVR